MCDSGHSEPTEAKRRALELLEQALVRHEAALAGVGPRLSHPPVEVLRRSVDLMRQEAERLRAELRVDLRS